MLHTTKTLGYSSDDINKFLWPVRIGSGVYPNDMPNERDFLSGNGNFDVGPGGAPALHNCVAYKLCYYRFGQMGTEYGKPLGYDRARGREIGKKNFELTTMEEAFTSEHWIVRIYKVKKRPNLEATPNAKKLRSDRKKTDANDTPASDESRFVGCFASESSFIDKIYEGGSTGANYNLALHHAKTTNKRYFAVARSSSDGHSFSFSSIREGPNSKGTISGGGCERPCADLDDKVCGCTDLACTGPIPKGEEHNRRWAVYEVISKK